MPMVVAPYWEARAGPRTGPGQRPGSRPACAELPNVMGLRPSPGVMDWTRQLAETGTRTKCHGLRGRSTMAGPMADSPASTSIAPTGLTLGSGGPAYEEAVGRARNERWAQRLF